MTARWFWGHSVLVAVVSSAAVGAVTALLCILVPTAMILVDVVSRVVSPLIVDGVVLDRRRLLSSKWRLLMDRRLPFVSDRLVMLLRAYTSSPRC